MKKSEAYAAVTRAYLTVLGRCPENEGADYWARRLLEDPKFTVFELIREFAHGPERYRVTGESWGVNAYYKSRGGMPPGMMVLNWDLSLEARIRFLCELVNHEDTIVYTRETVEYVLQRHDLKTDSD